MYKCASTHAYTRTYAPTTSVMHYSPCSQSFQNPKMSTSVHSVIHDHFRGYARLNLANIQLMPDEDVHEADVQELIRNFESRGCLQHDPVYAISVMVDSDTLTAATNGQTDFTSSDGQPFRHINIRATCLHGKHRILAARIALHEHDRWWTARLFDSGRRAARVEATCTYHYYRIADRRPKVHSARVYTQVKPDRWRDLQTGACRRS
jgi:hypothetical protein